MTAAGAARVRSALAWSLGTAALVAAAALSPRALPFDMDEFVAYQPLGCATHPLTRQANTVREACGEYDLVVPFAATAWPLRAYRYIGSLPAVAFAPTWWLIHAPVAGRVQGALYLTTAIAFIALLTRARPRNAVIACFLFPLLVVAFVADTGPVGPSAVAFLATLLALRAALAATAPGRAFALAVAAGIAAFCGLWVKLVFVWWLPAILLFAYWQARGVPARRLARALAAFAIAAALPSLALLTARDHDGIRYAHVLQRRSGFGPRLVHSARAMAVDLVDSSQAIVRQERIAHVPLDVVPMAAALAFVARGAWRRTARGQWTRRWAALALLTLAVMIPARPEWPHHFVYALVPLVLALTSALAALEGGAMPSAVVAGSLALLVWAGLAVRLPLAIARSGDSFDKDRLGEFVRREGFDRRNVEVHLSWGTFYIAHLFDAPDACVVYARGAREEAVALPAARRFADGLHRGVLVIRNGPEDDVQHAIATRSIGPPLQAWRFGDWSVARYVR
jgi:hypothetical protein